MHTTGMLQLRLPSCFTQKTAPKVANSNTVLILQQIFSKRGPQATALKYPCPDRNKSLYPLRYPGLQ
jgi:hypothetical protein